MTDENISTDVGSIPTSSADEPTIQAPGGPPGDGEQRALDAERKARKKAEREAREKGERLAEMEAAALRREVAEDKGLTDAQARFLQGSDREEMEATADELLAAFKPAEPDVRRRPRERLRPGAAPGPEPTDYGSVADSVLKAGW